jgi:hypothetical protein
VKPVKPSWNYMANWMSTQQKWPSAMVSDVIDSHHGLATVELTALALCDAQGLAALVRMAGHAEQKGCPFG